MEEDEVPTSFVHFQGPQAEILSTLFLFFYLAGNPCPIPSLGTRRITCGLQVSVHL